MKSRSIRIAILLCVSIVFIPVINRTPVVARTTRSIAARQQQTLVKRINQGALRFYKAFIRQSGRTTGTVDCELNELLEDLLLAVDSLTDPRYVRHNLPVVMQIAIDLEQELLLVDISPEVVMAWSDLHANLSRLAKMKGIKWSEPITNELIAALISKCF